MKFLPAVTALLLALAVGCDGPAYDCHTICERYRDCVDGDYDVAECSDRCTDDAERDEDVAERADDCQECLDEKTCGESVSCVDECVGIVP